MKLDLKTGEQIFDDNETFSQNYDVLGISKTAIERVEQVPSLTSISNISEEPVSPNVFTNGQVGGYLESQNYKQGQSGWKLFPDGSAEFTDLFVTSNIKTVSVGENIQDAINFVNTHGGGEVHLDSGTFILTENIILYSGISLTGNGIDSTILDANNKAFNIQIHGTVSNLASNVHLANFTVKNSTSNYAIDMQFTDRWSIDFVKATTCGGSGFAVSDCLYFTLSNCQAIQNSSSGYLIIGTAARGSNSFNLISCTSSGNGNNGFTFQVADNRLTWGSMVDCIASGNSVDGFDLSGTSASALETSFVNCISNNNTTNGFDVDGNCQRVFFISCTQDLDGNDGFQIDGGDFILNSCFIGGAVRVTADGIIIGNRGGANNVDPTTKYIIPEQNVQSYLNADENTRTIRKSVIMQNTSGGTLNQGDIVILKAVASGDQITTTTAVGVATVFGMVDTTITNNSWGRVLREGYTTHLKVNGTTPIAIGDFISTYSVKKIGAKASAGQTAIAIALEAYSTADSNGIIDALIIPPRAI